MRVVIGSDHAGFELKQEVAKLVREAGHELLDVGAFGPESVDYPDFAEAVGKAVLEGRAERGLLLCGSGVGAAVAANKLPGIRAGLCHDTYSAHQGVEHDDMNVLVLGARVIGPNLAQDLVLAFVQALNYAVAGANNQSVRLPIDEPQIQQLGIQRADIGAGLAIEDQDAS